MIVPAATSSKKIFYISCFVLFTSALLYPVYFNGFPILNYDTGTYLESSFTFLVPTDRPIGYSLLLEIGRLSGSLTAVAASQAAVTAWLLIAFLSLYLGYRPVMIAVVLGGSVLLTPLPFEVSLLYPDVTSFWIPLAALIFFSAKARFPSRLASLLVLSLAVLASYANILLVIFMMAMIGVARFLLSPARGVFLRRKGVTMIALPLFFLLLPPIVNMFLGYGFRYSKASHVFVFGNYLAGDGGGVLRAALEELPRTDPENPLNDHLDLLLSGKGRGPSWFLWSADSPLNTDSRLRGWIGDKRYLQPVINDTLRNNFPAVVRKVARDFTRQLTLIQPGYVCRPVDEKAKVLTVLGERFPGLKEEYLRSRQQRGRLTELMEEQGADDFFRWVFIGAGALAVIVLLASLGGIGGKSARAPETILPLFFILYYLFNALLVSATAGLSPRYTTRVSALVVIALILLIAGFLKPESGDRFQLL